MQPPLIELIPGRPAVRDDEATILDVLVRITPPLPEIHVLRPPVNLGIVLDRSGSMSEGRKMEHAREATVFAIRQLLPTDRVSITVFDDQVETISASAPVTDKPGLVAQIKKIGPRGSTRAPCRMGLGRPAGARTRRLAGPQSRAPLERRPGEPRTDRPRGDLRRSSRHGRTPGEHLDHRRGRQLQRRPDGRDGPGRNGQLLLRRELGPARRYLPDRASGLDGDHGPPGRAHRPPETGSRACRGPHRAGARPGGPDQAARSGQRHADLDPGEDQGCAPAAQVRALPLPPGLGSHRRGAPGSSGARSEPGPPGRVRRRNGRSCRWIPPSRNSSPW